MGVVYRAHDERLSRDVALKFLPPGAVSDKSAHARFRGEALALAKLNHPNIATIFELETQGDTDFLVIEFIPGQSLNEKLLAGPFGEKEVLRLGEQLAAGLAAAHDHGVLHRDLKPANLRLTPEGLLKILDFGLAKLFGVADTILGPSSTTMTTAVPLEKTGAAGTPPYMAPEQISGGAIDVRTDVYGAGAVLYELASGRPPFSQHSPVGLAHSILYSLPTPLRSIARVSPGLEEVILKALAKDPAERQPTAHSLLDDLRRISMAPGRSRRSRAIDSIAVLPFENATGDSQADYLSEGLTDTLIHSLSALPEFKKVIARNSVFRFRGRDVNPEQIGRELSVRAVLLGRIVRRGDLLVTTAELVDASDSRHVWGAQYEHKLNEVYGLQYAIADDICRNLGLKLKHKKPRAVEKPASSDAYHFYLKGRYLWNKRPAAGMVHKAIEYFEQATEADPKFALAYAGLADCYNTLGAWEASALAPQIAFPQSKMAAARALRLDPQLAEAHAAQAYTALHFDWDWQGAQQGFRRALQLNSNYAYARHWYAHFLVAIGNFEQALVESRRIIELDPLDLIINAHLAWHYQMAHQFPEALDTARRTLELEPNLHWGHFFAGWAHEQLGEFDKAVDALNRSVELSGGSTVMKAALGHAYARAGDHAAARRVLDDLGAVSATRYVSPYEIGLIHLALDEHEEGWQLLERACAEHSGWMPYLRAEPRLVHLHGNRRFQALLPRLSYPNL
jgi:eukaryotic-like serine/threonine-protein kinase